MLTVADDDDEKRRPSFFFVRVWPTNLVVDRGSGSLSMRDTFSTTTTTTTFRILFLFISFVRRRRRQSLRNKSQRILTTDKSSPLRGGCSVMELDTHTQVEKSRKNENKQDDEGLRRQLICQVSYSAVSSAPSVFPVLNSMLMNSLSPFGQRCIIDREGP